MDYQSLTSAMQQTILGDRLLDVETQYFGHYTDASIAQAVIDDASSSPGDVIQAQTQLDAANIAMTSLDLEHATLLTAYGNTTTG